MFNRQITFALFFVLAFVTGLRAGPADDLFREGNQAYESENYPGAIEKYEEIIKKYASASIIDAVRLNLGLAYLYSGKYPQSTEVLAKLTAKGVPNDIREPALFYLGQAQLSQAGTLPAGDTSRPAKLNESVKNFTTQVTEFSKSALREDVLYNRALAYFFLEKYEDAEKDFQTLIDEFSGSVNKVDYVFWKGRTFAARATKALTDKKPKEEAVNWAKKAKDVYASITDADNLVVANDARFEAAELDFFVAEKDDYPRVIEEFNKVRRQADVLPDQQAKIEVLRKQYADAAKAADKARMDQLTRQRTRAQGRLSELQGRIDPAIKAALRKAQCYVLLGRFDEARVLLHRLQPYVTDESDKKDVQFQTILAYALQGQIDKAGAGLDEYLKAFPNDKEADIISFQIGNTLMQNKEYQLAYDQYARSLKDFPKGRYADQATLRQASAMIGLGQVDKAIGILNDFVTKNPKSPNLAEAQYSLAAAQMVIRKFDDAAKNFKAVRDNPQAGNFGPLAHFQLGLALFQAGQADPALTELRSFVQKFPNEPTIPSAQLYIALLLDQKKDPGAMQALNDIVTKYPEDPSAPFALNYISTVYERERKVPEMLATLEKVYKTFPKSPEAAKAQRKLALYYGDARQKKYDDAAKLFDNLIKGEDKTEAAFAAWAAGDMWARASKEYGAYTRITADEQKEVRRRLEASEKAYVTLIREFPESSESARGMQGLMDLAQLRVEYGLLTNEQVGKYFSDIAAQINNPTTTARLQLVQNGILYEQGKRDEAFAEYKKIVAANPDVPMTPGDARRYGELLLQHDDLDAALALFTKLQANSAATDKFAQAEVAFGLGASYFAKKDFPQAKANFERLLTKDYAWHPKSWEGRLRLGQIARADKDIATAKKMFTAVMTAMQAAPPEIRARATIEMGDVLFDEGVYCDKTKANAAAFYLKAESYYGDAMPEVGAEALFKAGQAYEKGGQPADARKYYEELIKKYGKSPYATKAAERVKSLPAAAPAK